MTPLAPAAHRGRPWILVLPAALGALGLTALPAEVGPLAARAALAALAVGVAALLWRRGAGSLSRLGRLARPERPALAVVARAGLGRATGVALVEVGGRRLLLGVSERSVELLCELEPPPGGCP